MNPFTLGMWSSIIPFLVTKRRSSLKLSWFRGAQGTYDEDFDEVCVTPEGKSAISQFLLSEVYVSFSVASCGIPVIFVHKNDVAEREREREREKYGGGGDCWNRKSLALFSPMRAFPRITISELYTVLTFHPFV